MVNKEDVPCFKGWKKDTRYFQEHSDCKIKCPCGHTITFPGNMDRKLCDWCGHYVYKNSIAEFKYKTMQAMGKKYNEIK